MKNSFLPVSVLCCLLTLQFFGFAQEPACAATAAGYLIKIMDQFHKTYNVFTDADAAGNHFVYKGRTPPDATDVDVPPMKDCSPMIQCCSDHPRSGINCIECTIKTSAVDWGGWYFMNGYLEDEMVEPGENWGGKCDAGIRDLAGATELIFWVKGAEGGERVEFFAFGVGRDGKQCPDSEAKISLGYISLSNHWEKQMISLKGKKLTYVLGGFGWVASKAQNNGRDITFYLDDIQYKKDRSSLPRFLVSYRTQRPCEPFDIVMRNVAFTYDNAVALLAFLASGENKRAKLLADALVYALKNDRFFRNPDFCAPDSRRLRNAYQGGDLILWPGWNPNGFANTVRMPGFNLPGCYPDCGNWKEDLFQVSTHTGNVAWAMLGLLAYYEKFGGAKYLNAAQYLGKWVEAHCRSNEGPGGYTGGYEGWETPGPLKKLTYKATEHNIDLYAAFQRLYKLTNEVTWRRRANHAKKFVEQMWHWDPEKQEGHFWTGTDLDGVTTNTNPEQIPLDIQAWANLALPGETKYRPALNYAENHHGKRRGFDFNFDPLGPDGIWYEGTAQMALAYYATGQMAKCKSRLNCLHGAQYSDGGLPAASKDGLTTGYPLPDGKPWLYYRRAHVGATAWLVLAEKGFNPFWPFNQP